MTKKLEGIFVMDVTFCTMIFVVGISLIGILLPIILVSVALANLFAIEDIV